MKRTLWSVVAAVATLAIGTLVVTTTPAGSTEQRANHCLDGDGADLNELYETNDAFVTETCRDMFVGSSWRPLARWGTAATFVEVPPGYEPEGATPSEDFIAKIAAARYEITDALTGEMRSIEVAPEDLLIDTRPNADGVEVTYFTPRLRPLREGHYFLHVLVTLSAEHWDGFGVDTGNHLPAGESFFYGTFVTVSKPEPEPLGPPPPTDPALRIELVWDDEADLDLHFLHPNGEFNTAPWDCYWANTSPNWGRIGSQWDDPRLEVDNTEGFGPEIITLPRLENVSYTIGVQDFFNPEGGPTTATVRVWAGSALLSELTIELPDERWFWTVATVELQARNIVVTPINELNPPPPPELSTVT